MNIGKQFLPCSLNMPGVIDLLPQRNYDPFLRARAISSAVEHCLHTAGVTGSIPVSPTTRRNRICRNLHVSLRQDCGARNP